MKAAKNRLFVMWLMFGIKRKWITGPVCDTHEWLDMVTEEELNELDEDGEPCIFVLRVLR